MPIDAFFARPASLALHLMSSLSVLRQLEGLAEAAGLWLRMLVWLSSEMISTLQAPSFTSIKRIVLLMCKCRLCIAILHADIYSCINCALSGVNNWLWYYYIHTSIFMRSLSGLRWSWGVLTRVRSDDRNSYSCIGESRPFNWTRNIKLHGFNLSIMTLLFFICFFRF